MTKPLAMPGRSVGIQIRDWRQRRRLSQLDFALDAEISQRHLSFIESGRSTPSREMILRLADHLAVPLRERNAMVLAAGYAPVFPERSLDDPDLAPARRAIDMILKGHEPYPALAVDRLWRLVTANAAVTRLLGLVADQALLEPPVNVLRLSLAPGGLAPHIVNLGTWRLHVLERLRAQVDLTGDAVLAALREEIAALPAAGDPAADPGEARYGDVAVPLRLRTPLGELALITTTTVFGTPVDVTLSELALEMFFPTDEATARVLRAMAGDGSG
ncbi:MAG: helix-turn-helix transcriptional regulator [Burkholderiales bacterium]|nr:helix-turn-helix transcriptional regulator [Burkholderiales bacterium]